METTRQILTNWILLYTAIETTLIWKIWKWTKNDRTRIFCERVYLLTYIDVFFQRCFVLDQTTVHDEKKIRQERMFCFYWAFSDCIQELKLSFQHISALKIVILSAWFFWDATISSREKDQKFQIAGPIGYGTRTWSLHFVTPNCLKYMQYYIVLL